MTTRETAQSVCEAQKTTHPATDTQNDCEAAHDAPRRQKDTRRRVRTDTDRAKNAERARQRRATRAARNAAEHAVTGIQPRCRCHYCLDARPRLAAQLKHGTLDRYRLGCTCHYCTAAFLEQRRRHDRTAKAAKRAQTRPTTPAKETASDGWAFTRYAAHQADPNPRQAISPKAVVCCETEALEPEGAGHDWWCPTRIDLDWKAVA